MLGTDIYLRLHLNESSGTNVPDTSGNARNGTCIKMEDADWAAGKLNNCLVFNMDAGETNEYVNLGDIANFEYNQPFSLECWYICNTDAGEYTIISRKTTTDFKGWSLKMFYGYPYIHYQSNTTYGIQKRTTAKYVDSNWHHLVVTYNGNGLSTGVIFYVDGSPVAMTTNQNTNGTNTWINATNCQLGAHNATYCYKGSLDEVLIYSKVLSSAEVTARYNSGNGTEELDFTQACNETLATAEVRTISTGKNVVETLSNADGVKSLIGKNISEILGLSDSRIIDFIKLMSEGLSFSDKDIIDFYKPLNENLGLSDNFSRIISFYRLLTETISISDQRSYSINKKLIELLSLLDSISRVVDYKRTLTEGITLTSAEKEKFSKLLKETMTLTSSMKRKVDKLLKETLHLVDVYSRIVNYKRTFPETLHLVDNRRLLFYKPLEEALFLYGISKKEVRKKILESLLLNSILSKSMEFHRLLNEVIKFNDPSPITITLTIPISLSSDDANRTKGYYNTLDLSSSDSVGSANRYGYLWNWESGMRFQDIQLPKNATILSVYLKLTADSNGYVFPTKIQGEKSTNPITFSTKEDYDSRPATTNTISWIPSEWLGPYGGIYHSYSSPDIKTIIEEIRNQDGWNKGNSMVLFWKEVSHSYSDRLSAFSFDTDPYHAPMLEITYSMMPVPLSIEEHKKLLEGLNLLDSKILRPMKKLSQTLQLSDKRTFRIEKNLKETLNLLDQVNRSIAFLRFLTETLSLNSQEKIDFSKNLSEQILFLEGMKEDFAKTLLETLTLIGEPKQSFWKNLKEHMFVIEDFRKEIRKLLKENMTLSDTINVMAYFILYVIGDILLGYPKMSRSIIKLTYSKLQRHTMLLARRIQRITAKLLKRRRIKTV